MEKTEQADNEAVDDQSLPEEIARRTERLEKIRQAKAMIEQRAAERYEEEKAAHDQKMAIGQKKKNEQGRKRRGVLHPRRSPARGIVIRLILPTPNPGLCPPAITGGSKPITCKAVWI